MNKWSHRFVAVVSMLIILRFISLGHASFYGEKLSLESYLKLTTAQRYTLFGTLSAKLDRGENLGRLEIVIPRLKENLEIARTLSAAYWTDSTVIDALTQKEILSLQLLDALNIEHRTTAGVMHVPAGVMHTYGYLFSRLPTKYGFKGKRWIESRLDERLGLAAGTFSPFTRGEFLSNVTAVLEEIIPFPGTARPAPALEEILEKHIAPGLKEAFSSLRFKQRYMGALVEHVEWRMSDGTLIKGDVRTHLVELDSLKGQESGDRFLLVYDMAFENRHRRFVTAFPVDSEFGRLLQSVEQKKDAQFKPLFNLYLDPSWTVVSHESEGFKKGR